MKMRKIISKQERESKGRRNQFIIGGILILVMVMSTIGYAFNREEDSSIKIMYNGFEFTKDSSGFWGASIGEFQFLFKYNPKETGENNYELNRMNSYYNKPLYIYSNSNEAEIEIYRNLFYQNQIVQRMQYACSEGDACEGDYPVKNCTDNFIIIKESNNSGIRQQENCVFIQGKNEDLAKLADSFLFKITGIQ